MTTDKSKAGKPTAADKEASVKLSALWRAFKRKHPGITQESFALGIGMTQGGFSQYLHGDVRFNARAVLRFASALGCSPLDIRDDLPELHAAMPPPNDPQARELWSLWPRLDPRTKKYLLETARDKVQLEQGTIDPFEKPTPRIAHHKRTTS